ncbi:MAG: hypothetical protein RI953_2364 [Pseudomonadota bacterium]|jgi:hypothetical protein
MSITNYKRIFFFSMAFICVSCGGSNKASDAAETMQTHLVLHPTYSMPLPSGFSISEIALRRVDCENEDTDVEHVLPVVESEGVFVFNVPEAEIRECGILVRRVVLKSKTSELTFNLIKQTRTQKGSRELFLAPSTGTAGLTLTLPEKTAIRVEQTLDWPMNLAYDDYREGKFPRVASYSESTASSLNLRLSAVEDRGIVSSSWRELGITLTCDTWAQFLECSGVSLLKLLGRFVREGDVSIETPAQVKTALAQSSLQFESTLSHFIGSGLRFTMLYPLAWQDKTLLLLVGRDQQYNVFKIEQNLIAPINQ